MTARPAPLRSVVVTGVGRRGQLGEALALAFARDGARVSLIAHSQADADARAGEMHAAGLDVRPFAANLSDASAAAEVAGAVARLGDIDALVNAAGGFGLSGPVAESDPAEFRRQVEIGLFTAYGATRAFLPHLRRSRGSVVFFASAAALPGARVAGVSGYAAAKAAVITLMRAVAQEERASGVRANAVAPAAVRTAANAAAMPAASKFVETDAVYATVGFLCSPGASAITGQVFELAP